MARASLNIKKERRNMMFPENENVNEKGGKFGAPNEAKKRTSAMREKEKLRTETFSRPSNHFN